MFSRKSAWPAAWANYRDWHKETDVGRSGWTVSDGIRKAISTGFFFIFWRAGRSIGEPTRERTHAHSQYTASDTLIRSTSNFIIRQSGPTCQWPRYTPSVVDAAGRRDLFNEFPLSPPAVL